MPDKGMNTKMCQAYLLLLLLMIIPELQAKTYERCQLARLFLHKYKFPKEHIDDCEYEYLRHSWSTAFLSTYYVMKRARFMYY